jgi:hypothetical protein
MSKSHSGAGGRSQRRMPPFESEDKIQYLLGAEERLLQSISTGAPLPGALNGICSALDCQIGNVVSLISLPEDDPSELAAIAMHAAFFGLYTFCSEGVVAENNELLGSLEMYCSSPRSPSARESQWIERAKCLAAIAIKLDQEAAHQGNGDARENRPVRGRVLPWPVSMN